MCGRFVNTTNINRLKKIFEIKEPLNTKRDIISYNIAPSQDVNIILSDKHLTIEAINWGIQFIDKRNNQIRTVINSRLETVQEKILFKESFLKPLDKITSKKMFLSGEWDATSKLLENKDLIENKLNDLPYINFNSSF